MRLQGGRAWVGGVLGICGCTQVPVLAPRPSGFKGKSLSSNDAHLAGLSWGGGGMLWGTVIPDPPGPGAG